MNESANILMEISFDVAYLITIWIINFLMLKNRSKVQSHQAKLAKLWRWMFLLLAIGDTGHVGFRVIAYSRGPLENSPTLVGIGALATAITITFFYMLFVAVWRERFNHARNWLTWSLMAVGILRLGIMFLPGNRWESVIPPEPMGILRNIPLMVMGGAVMVMILWSAKQSQDKTYAWIGFCVFLSYLFYTPVILFVTKVPLLGILMMPKTLAYVAIALIVYFDLYKTKPKKQ